MITDTLVLAAYGYEGHSEPLDNDPAAWDTYECDTERWSAAQSVLGQTRDAAADVWSIPVVSDCDQDVHHQAVVAAALHVLSPERHLFWPDGGEGSAVLVVPGADYEPGLAAAWSRDDSRAVLATASDTVRALLGAAHEEAR